MVPTGGALVGGNERAHAGGPRHSADVGCPRYLAPRQGRFRSLPNLCLRVWLSGTCRAVLTAASDRGSSEKIGCPGGATHSRTRENGWFLHRRRCSADNIVQPATLMGHRWR